MLACGRRRGCLVAQLAGVHPARRRGPRTAGARRSSGRCCRARPPPALVLRRDRLVEGSDAAAGHPRRAGRRRRRCSSPRSPFRSVRAASRCGCPSSRPSPATRESFRLPAMPRGVHVVGPVTYEKTDPVGLVRGGSRSASRVELLVAPRVTDLSVFAGGLTNDLDGATSQQLSMSDLAFHALREYVPGDDLRHVHWRSSAKAGELLVRQYHETRRGHVTVLVDDAAGLLPAGRATSSSRSRWRRRSPCGRSATTSTPTCAAARTSRAGAAPGDDRRRVPVRPLATTTTSPMPPLPRRRSPAPAWSCR